MTDNLNTIAFHITDNCNAHCPMCYENAQQNLDLNGELDTLKKIAHNAIRYGKVENFLMVGGDPCAFPHLIELMRYIKDEGERYGVDTFIEVLSNTHDYRENGKIVPMEEVVKLVDKMNITVHGSTPLLHDIFNGVPGSYNHMIENVRKYIECKGDDQSVGLTLNIMPHTIYSLENIILNTNRDLGGNIVDLCIQRIAPVGRAEGNLEFLIEKPDVNVFMPVLEKAYQSGMGIDICDCFPYCSVKDEYRHLLPKGGCQWGRNILSVQRNGDMTRCALSSRVIGNMVKLDSEEKYFDWWENCPELESFRRGAHLNEACKQCKQVDECGGGCLMARDTGDPYRFGAENVTTGRDYLATTDYKDGK